jgi:cytochrome c oxidase accessory protein FixG
MTALARKIEPEPPLEIAPESVSTKRTATKRKSEASLYAGRVKPYPQTVHGQFRKLKWIAMLVLLGIYYLAPFLRWDRGPGRPDQAILVDMQQNRGYFFFIEIWPQEVYYITGLLVLAALGLFMVTALAGRVWCGYACPQTVWTDLFRKVEAWIEGDRNARIKRDQGPFSLDKAWRKTVKHVIWVAIAFATGGAWIMYFHDAPTIIGDFFTGDAGEGAYLFVALLTFTTYTLGGIAQEQVCTYMCPWPRIQAAMLDKESLFVTYRKDLGEPRMPVKQAATARSAGLPAGTCIDCGKCAQACPQGIDIRDGAQLECIQCALCVDACDAVMDKIGQPRGLVAYVTEANLEREARGEPKKYNLLRPRIILYAAVMLFVSTVMLYALTHRGDLELNLLRDRNPVYVQLSDGDIRNGFTLKILNKSAQHRTFSIAVQGVDGAQINMGIGVTGTELKADPDKIRAQHMFVVLPEAIAKRELVNGELPISIVVTDTVTGQVQTADTVFRGPIYN